MPLSARSPGVAALALALGCLLLGCNSDEKPRSAVEETTEGGTTTETSGSSSESTDEGPPPDRSCRDAVECILGCAAQYPDMPTPEDPDLDDYFLMCFLECGKDLEAEEALALIRLVSCVSQKCYGEMACIAPGAETDTGMVDTTDTSSDTGPTQDELCTQCLGGGLLDPESPGCQAEAAACT